MSKKKNTNREVMTKRAKKFNTKKKIIFGIILMLIVAATFAGYKILSNHTVDFIEIDEENEKYQSRELEKPDGAVVTDYFNKPNDVLFIANWLVSNSPYYDSDFEGVALAKVAGINYRQVTKVYKAINDDEAFHQTLSISSLVKVALQRYITQNSYLQRNGKNASETGATFDNNISSISKEKYLELYGNLPFGMSQYILRDEYILNSSYVGEKDGLYSFSYEFAPYDATLKYARQVKTMAGANGLPEFTRANFVLTVDKDFYVQSIAFDEYYDLPLMGGLKITLTATENFHFYDQPIEVKERSEFEPFFNAVVDDSKADAKTGMTYLTEAFSPLMDGGAINIHGNIKFADYNYSLDASVDMGNMNINAKLGDDIALSYHDDAIFLMLGDNKIKVETEELLNVLIEYLDFDLTNMSLDSLLESPVLSSALDNMEENITNDKCALRITLAEGVETEIKLNIDSSNNATLDKISASIEVEDEKIDIDIAFVGESITYPSFEDASEIKDVAQIIDNIIEMIENHQFGANLEFTIPLGKEELKVNGNILVDLNYDNLLLSKANANITVSYLGIELPLLVVCQDDEVTISYKDNWTVKISVDEIKELLSYVELPEIPEIDLIETIKEVLSKLDLNNLIQELSYENGLKLILNISDFIDFDNNISLEVADRIKLGIDDYGFIEIFGTEYKEANIPTTNVLDYQGILNYINIVESYIENPLFKFDVNFKYQDLAVIGNVWFDVSSLNVDAILNVTYQDLSIDIKLKKVEDIIQLLINDKLIEISIEDLISLFEKINTKYELIDVDEVTNELTKYIENIDLDKLLDYVPTILDALFISNDEISLSIDPSQLFDINLDIINILYEIENETLSVYNDLFTLNVSKEDNYEFKLLTGDKLSYSSIEKILDTIVKVINGKYLRLAIDASYEDFILGGTIVIDYQDLAINTKLQVKYQDIEENVELQFIDNVVQIKLGNLVFSLTIDEIIDLLTEINDDFNILDESIFEMIEDIMNGNLPDVELDVTSIIPFIPYAMDALSISDEAINIFIDTNDFDLNLGSISLNYLINEEKAIINSNYADIEICLLDNWDISLFEDANFGYEEISTLYHTVINALDNLLLKAEVDVKVDDIDVSGIIYIDVFNLNISFDATLTYQDLSIEVYLVKYEDIIQLNIGNIVIELTTNDIETFLKELQTRYNILDNETIELIVNTLNGELPEFELDLSLILGIIPTVLEELYCEEGILSLSIDPLMFGLDFDTVDIAYDIQKETLNLHHSLFDGCVSIVDEYEFSLLTGSTVGIDTLISVLDTVSKVIENPLFEANIKYNDSISGLDLDINGKLVIDFNNLSIDGTIDAIIGPVKATINVIKLDDHIQIKLGNVVVDLSLDDIIELLYNIDDRYNVIPEEIITLVSDLLNGNLSFDYQLLIGLIPTILDNLLVNDEKLTLSFDPTMFDIDFENLNIEYGFAQEELQVSNSILDVDLYQIENHEFVLQSSDLITYNNIDQVLDKVDALIDLFSNKEFSLSVDGNVFDGTTYQYQISGSLYLKLKETNEISLEMIDSLAAHLLLIDTKMQHDIDLQIIDKVVYFTYTNYALKDTTRKTPKGTTKAYISLDKLFETLNYANQMFIKNDFINQLVGSYGKVLDTSVLDTVIFGDNELIDVTGLLNEVLISSTNLFVGINHDYLNDYYPGGIAEVSINNSFENDKVVIDEIKVENFYSAPNTKITLDAKFNDDYLVLTAPSTTGYINLDSVPELLNTLNNTIEVKNYDLEGSIELSIGDIFSLADIEMQLKISLNGSDVKVYGKLEVPFKTLVLKDITKAKTRTEIYYDSTESNDIYLKRSVYKKYGLGSLAYYTDTIASVEYKHQEAHDFLADLIDNICYMFNLDGWIKDLIVDGSSESSTDVTSTSDPLYYADLVKNYQYTSSACIVTANGKALTKGITSDISATINYLTYNNELYFNEVIAETSILSILKAGVNVHLKNFDKGYSNEAFIKEMSSYKLADFNH